jgi:hypothetical protein
MENNRLLPVLALFLTISFCAGFSSNAQEQELVGIWQDKVSDASGNSNRYRFYDDGFYVFSANAGDANNTLLHESGTWSISGETLKLNATGQISYGIGVEDADKDNPCINASPSFKIVNLIKELPVNLDLPPEEDSKRRRIALDGASFYDLGDEPWLLDEYCIAMGKYSGAVSANPDHKMQMSADGKNIIIAYPDNTTALYDANYKPLFLDGTLIKSDILNSHGNSLVPVRLIGEKFGYMVSWDAASKKVTIRSSGKIIEMAAGSQTVVVDGKKSRIGVSSAIHDSRTFVPLRFVAETLGAKVSYNGFEISRHTSTGVSLAQLAPASIVVDTVEYNHSISKQGALDRTKKSVRSFFEEFKLQNGNLYSADQTRKAYPLIEKSISSMGIFSEASCYYIMKGPKDMLYNKLTGEVHYYYKENGASILKKLTFDEKSLTFFSNSYFD